MEWEKFTVCQYLEGIQSWFENNIEGVFFIVGKPSKVNMKDHIQKMDTDINTLHWKSFWQGGVEKLFQYLQGIGSTEEVVKT